MSSIMNILEVLEGIDNSVISVNQNRCALVRNRNSNCRRCADSCTSGCISFTENGLEVDGSLCVGCGTCATVCPTGALESKSPSDDELLGSCANNLRKLAGEVVFVCSTMAEQASSIIDPEKCVKVPCLGRIDESLLTTIACAEAERISLVHGTCEQCSLRPGKNVAKDVVATTEELIDAWSIPSSIEIVDVPPRSCRQIGGSYDSSKRAFFGDLLAEVKTKATVQHGDDQKNKKAPLRFHKVMDDGTLPHFIPERRRRLLSVLGGRGEPEDTMVATRLWGHVLIDSDKCSSCRMCATFCPTAAITKYDSEDGSGIIHAPSACVKCRVCENICPEHALTLSDEVFAVDLIKEYVEKYPMKPRIKPKNQEDGVRDTMRSVLGSERIY